ncbi:MAG: c-type cytochrome [Geminicoccales bacterium]
MVLTPTRLIIGAGMLMVALGTTAAAEELLGDPIAGRMLAHDVCATCHVVEPGLEPRSDIDAPAFPDLAKQPGITALSLRVFLQTPHERMPDLRLSPDETDNVIAHILSLDR